MRAHSLRLATGLALLLVLTACHSPVRPTASQAAPDVAIEPAPPVATAPVATLSTTPSTPDAPVAPEPHRAMHSGAEVFDRLVAQMSPPICVEGDHNRIWRKRYAGHPSTFVTRLEAILPLLAFVVERVELADLPGEFALIPLVESWYRPEAIGPGGPAGLWQMIASTGRNNGLRIDSHYDGRLSPLDSTDAALKHLAAMVKQFGDWRAAAMAYNAGEYRLLRAMRHAKTDRVSGEQRLPAGLSRTTYDYVSKLQALSCLIAEAERHDLTLPRDAHFEPLREFHLPAGIVSLDQAAAQLHLDAKQLRQLNPAFRRGHVASSTPRRVLAPESAVIALTRGGAPSSTGETPMATQAPITPEPPRVHAVQRGDTLSGLAKRYGVRVSDLTRWNGIRTSSVLRIGQSLRVSD